MNKRIASFLIVTTATIGVVTAVAAAESPARQRELVCSDGTSVTAEQVRHGSGKPASAWRIVASDEDEPVVFSVHSVTVIAPDGTVVDSETWHHSEGVDRNRDLVTCSFIIPVGPYTDHEARFEGFFAPAR